MPPLNGSRAHEAWAARAARSRGMSHQRPLDTEGIVPHTGGVLYKECSPEYAVILLGKMVSYSYCTPGHITHLVQAPSCKHLGRAEDVPAVVVF